MKTIEQTAVEVGAEVHQNKSWQTDKTLSIVFKDANQLQAFFDARCAELSKPVAKVVFDRDNRVPGGETVKSRPQIWSLVSNEFLLSLGYDTKLYLAPQPSQDADYVKGLEDALRNLHDENISYIKLNNLCAEDNQCLVFARQALANKPLELK